MYITKHGDYKYLEEKDREGNLVFKISISIVKKILDAYKNLSREEQKLFLEIGKKRQHLLRNPTILIDPEELIHKKSLDLMLIHESSNIQKFFNMIKSRENVIALHGITKAKYEFLTLNCAICGFDKIVHLHHIDRNHANTNDNNLVGLCPNHHSMIHTRAFYFELKENLEKVGKLFPKDFPKKLDAEKEDDLMNS